jgi:hypothetical protein
VYCGAPVDDIHHAGMQFSEILREFIEFYDFDFDCPVNPRNQYLFKIGEYGDFEVVCLESINRAFEIFHEERAQLISLCKNCHIEEHHSSPHPSDPSAYFSQFSMSSQSDQLDGFDRDYFEEDPVEYVSAPTPDFDEMADYGEPVEYIQDSTIGYDYEDESPWQTFEEYEDDPVEYISQSAPSEFFEDDPVPTESIIQYIGDFGWIENPDSGEASQEDDYESDLIENQDSDFDSDF